MADRRGRESRASLRDFSPYTSSGSSRGPDAAGSSSSSSSSQPKKVDSGPSSVQAPYHEWWPNYNRFVGVESFQNAHRYSTLVVMMSYYSVVVQMYHTATLPHYHTTTLPHCHTTTLPLYHTTTLPHYHYSCVVSQIISFSMFPPNTGLTLEKSWYHTISRYRKSWPVSEFCTNSIVVLLFVRYIAQHYLLLYHTTSLPHYHTTTTLPHYHTTTLPHYHTTTTLPHYHTTTTLPHYHTTTLPHYHTTTLLHCHTTVGDHLIFVIGCRDNLSVPQKGL